MCKLLFSKNSLRLKIPLMWAQRDLIKIISPMIYYFNLIYEREYDVKCQILPFRNFWPPPPVTPACKSVHNFLVINQSYNFLGSNYWSEGSPQKEFRRYDNNK